MKKPADIKICFNAMVKNEAPTIERMLNSVWQYIDYWVIQDNGSEDGTQQIIENFFKEKGIPGFLYQIWEWKGHGWNRNHTLQTALAADHGCDWILRVDADEQLLIEDGFDWSPFRNTSIQSFNIAAEAGDAMYYRTWIWNAKLPWFFAEDLAHETIHLPDVDEDFQRVDLPFSIRHILTNDGMTWHKPMKFLKDALNLELTKVPTNEVLDNNYHLWYIGKSYNDSYQNPTDFPFGMDHAKEYARRTVFYFQMYLNKTHNYTETGRPAYIDDMGYYAMMLIGNAQDFLGNTERALECYDEATKFNPERNEAIVSKIRVCEKAGKFDLMLTETQKLISTSANLNPFPKFIFLIDKSCYKDTSYMPLFWRAKALQLNKLPFESVLTEIQNQHPSAPQWVFDEFNQSPQLEASLTTKENKISPAILNGVFGITQ